MYALLAGRIPYIIISTHTYIVWNRSNSIEYLWAINYTG